METPKFWTSRKHPLSRLLQPLGWLYAGASSLRNVLAAPKKASIPVICIGNVTAGGSGKTPVAIAIAEHLINNEKIDAHFLTRGYGGSTSEVKADLNEHTADQIGDEPMLLAKTAPTWVYPNRVRGAKTAASYGAELIIMDDGMQNPCLVKDMSFIVVDGKFGIGNGRIIPAGPLREHFEIGAKRADAIIIIGKDETGIQRLCPPSMPIFKASLEPNANDAEKIKGRSVIAFAGIGRPSKFFDTLRDIGCNVVSTYEFKDHYPYAPTDIQPILDEAFRMDAVPVTTAKDYVKLTLDQRQQINVLNVSIKWENDAIFNDIMSKITNLVKNK
ncbi:MAG: tetraacyldisaccharide 4'-kinase [Alphaproteobacteria bacterium]|nr:tetraacyldisaccharide 4'-kinase [Alphaproteobacteria bacterium]